MSPARQAMVAALLGACCAPAAADAPAGDPVGFNRHIRPILNARCAACHGGPKQAAGVSFLRREAALGRGASGERTIVPGDADASYLVARVSDPDDAARMPPADHGPRLSQREVDLVRRWIDQGAEWEEHWSFVKPERPRPPAVDNEDWPRHELDAFVLARLEREGLQPSAPADRAQWLRRVSFDLTGLPPTEEELSDFLSDNRPDAYECAVDRLVASPAYGERWATMWLDLARYADTMGYEKDPPRTIWPYRDWLIRSLNADMPYDQFIIRQLAGDLLPDASIDDRLATAFHRNTQTNTEGGTDDEEFRLAAVVDRVNTTWQAFHATTFGCAQCHAHPYDPIANREYYEFLAVFNNTRDADLTEDLPKLRVPQDRDDYAKAERLDAQVSQLKRELHARVSELADDLAAWTNLPIKSADSTGATELTIKTTDGVSEVVAGGTITRDSQYVLETALPERLEKVSAVRVEALPKDVGAARKIPELGFTLSRLRVFVVPEGGGEPVEALLIAGYCDEPEPMFDPEDSLQDNASGWSAYTKIFAPRHVVFLLDRPIEVTPGARLRFEMKHSRTAVGQIPLVIRRARFFASDDAGWEKLAGDADFQAKREQLARTRAERRDIPSVSTPVITERDPAAARRTFMFERGNWLARGEEVTGGVPDVMHEMPRENGGDRLDAARWIASRDNPLTSRALVNRLWEQLFGTGIVRTVEDLGASGERPSHPKLLDHLAVRFQDDFDWSMKRLLREIVLSATYRQDARVTPELAERDPNNRLLARGPRTRLTAEMVRDQALLVSGKLSEKRFGPPVMPYQPEGVWRSVYSSQRWEMSEGEDRFRRAAYIYWKRTSGYPSLMAFDAPSREVCSARRVVTNTPLQALVTLNDPAYVELARGLADRMLAEGGDAPRAQIAWAYRRATGDEPSTATVTDLEELYGDALQAFDERREEATELAPVREQYALTVVAGAIMNLDEALTK